MAEASSSRKIGTDYLNHKERESLQPTRVREAILSVLRAGYV